MIILAFGHRKRVGKDTLARFVKTHLMQTHPNLQITTIGFATKVKEVAYSIYSWAGLKREQFYDEHPEYINIPLPALGKTPRELWIDVGQSIRTRNEKVWVQNVFEPYKNSNVLLIKDIRFETEIEETHARGGVLIKVVNERVPDTDDEADSALASSSRWDYLALNNGTYTDLMDQAILIYERFIKDRL